MTPFARSFLVVLMAFPAVAAADALDTKLAAAANDLVTQMEAKNVGGNDSKTFTIAAVPLIDSMEKRPMKLGVEAANVLTRQLSQSGTEWLRVVDRMNLQTVRDEQRLWIADFVKTDKVDVSSGGGLVEKADLLVAGTTTIAGDDVRVALRVLSARSGSIVASHGFVLKAASVKGLLPYVERKKGDDRVASVSALALEVTAQRKERGRVKQWKIADGETLRKGDLFHVRFVPDADANVYVFMYGSDDKAVLIFPSDDWEEQYERQFGRSPGPEDNYCRADLDYHVPGPDRNGKDRFYQLDDTEGTNILYAAARREAVKGLKDIARRLEKASSHNERVEMLKDTFGFDHVETFVFQQK